MPPPLKSSRFGNFSTAVRDVTLPEDTVWEGNVLVEGSVVVPPTVTLTVRPGTTVRFRPSSDKGEGSALFVQGRLVASGSPDRPVVFTSDGTQPASGDWSGIVISGSAKNNLCEQCRIEYADTGIDLLSATLTLRGTDVTLCRTGIRSIGSYLTLNSSRITRSETGLSAFDSETEGRDVEISRNRTGVSSRSGSLYLSGFTVRDNAGTGIYLDSGPGIFRDGTVTANGTGMEIVSSDAPVEGSRFLGNRLYGLVLSAARGPVSGNRFEGNARGGILVRKGASGGWGNLFAGNGPCDVELQGDEDFNAAGNRWSSPPERRTCDGRLDPARGIVRTVPALPPELPANPL